MKLGFFVSNGTFGLPSVNEGGVDNWRVEITQVPAPRVLVLVLSAVANSLGWMMGRRTTKRRAIGR